jgi:hypothetical protein
VARKPARLERAGALTPRDRMWAAIRALATPRDPDTEAWFSPVEVQFLVNLHGGEPVHVDSILSYLGGLAKAEPPYVSLADGDRPQGRKRTELFLYRLLRDVGVDAPRVTAEGRPVTQGIANERMWAAMKVLREFNYAELVQAASDEAHQVSEETAKNYCLFLCRAGYLGVSAKAVHGKAKARYRFNRSKNTGPRAPLICRDKSVMDANTAQTVWTPKAKGGKECKEQT